VIKSSKIQEILLELLSDGQNHSVQEIKRYLEERNIGPYSEGQFAGSINTLLRNGSIRKIDRGIYSIITREENMKKCFVVSPIGEEGSETRNNANKVFKYIIKPVCEACGFEAIRVDQLNDAGSITQAIIKYLEEAELVIADISGHNPNVFYEIGYRARTKKPIVHLKNKAESIPFDVNTIRTFEYALTDLDSVEEVKERLIQTIHTFDYSENEESDTDGEPEKVSSSIMPVLYQILDSVQETQKEMKDINAEIIGTVIKSMQNAQPQISPETALQMQMMRNVMQNPDNFMKLIEISEKFK
jgi:nucleoside 2-deoxyribosyltransferase